MRKPLLEAAERFGLLRDGDSVIIALSGGADSVALLHALYSVKEKYHLTLYAAHLNHCLRGEEAQRDESFCKILCENYQIPLTVERRDIRALAAQRSVSEELCGRQERYAFFASLAQRYGAKIATAHTASDNAETLLYHICRGSAVRGAAAIPVQRGNIIRPLLFATRQDVEAYCEQHRLRYVTDSTNLTDDYTRNRLRHRVIPECKAINPDFEAAALRFSQNAAEVGDYLDMQARQALAECQTAYGCSAAGLLQYHTAVQKAAIALLCRDSGIAPQQKHILLIAQILRTGGAAELSKRVTAVCSQGTLRFVTAAEEQPLHCTVQGETHVCHGGKRYTVSVDNSDKEIYMLRHRESGDTFTFARRGLTKPLRRALQEQRVPAERRDSLVLLCREHCVLWCEALGYSAQGEALQKNHLLTVTVTDEP